MTIAVGVVAHESREQVARALRYDVGAVSVNVDDGTLGCDGNHIAVLRTLMYRHVDWCVVLEDDAQPVRDFRVHLTAALRHAPAPIVGLYLGYEGRSPDVAGEAVIDARLENKAWIVGDCLIGSVAYAIRIRHIEPMLAAVGEVSGVEWPLRITRWAQSVGLPICYTVPSLVDHGVLPSTDCTMGDAERAFPARKAFICSTRDDWNTGVMPLGLIPGWSRPRGE